MQKGQLSNDWWLAGASTALGEWYALQTRYQCEKRVDLALRDVGFETFAPVRAEQRRWSDRTKLIQSPLFPGYTFVRMETDSKSLLKVMRLPGIVRFVTTGRELVPIPDEEIEAVRGLLQSHEAYEAAPFPALGERVRIRGGCLDGIEGIITSHLNRREIIISVGAIRRSLKVPLGNYTVECLD